jgi:hypothetical protein
MPTITPDIALILAADKLVDAIAGVVPKNSITKDAIIQLMAIYCKQTLAASDAESAQRVLRKIAATQRTQLEATPAGSQRVNDNAWMDEIEDETESASAAPDAPTLRLTSRQPNLPPCNPRSLARTNMIPRHQPTHDTIAKA